MEAKIKNIDVAARALFDDMQEEIESDKLLALITKALRIDRIDVARVYRQRLHELLKTWLTHAGEEVCETCGRKCQRYVLDGTHSFFCDLDGFAHGKHCVHAKLFENRRTTNE